MHDTSGRRTHDENRRRNRALIVYYNGTFVHLRNGAHMRMASLMTYLIGQGYDITLYSFANHATEPWDDVSQALFRQTYPGVRLVLDKRTALMRHLTSIKNGLTSLFPIRAREILAIRHAQASPAFDRLVRENPDATWILNYADGLTQLNGVPPGRIIVETHDLKCVNVAKKDEISPFGLRSLLRMRSELSVLATVAGVVAISPVEAGFFRTMLSATRTYYIPQYGASEALCRDVTRQGEYRYDLVFVGSEMFQNARGLLQFFRANSDWLSQLRIAVAGKVGTDPEVKAFAEGRTGISLLGFVADISALYASAKAAISPVDGTGLKIKVIEALGHGLPVFGSVHTLEGLAPGYEACVFPLTRANMQPLLDDSARLESAREAALTYYQGLSKAGDIAAFADFLDSETPDVPAFARGWRSVTKTRG
jgi:hypothetical protein